MNYTFQGFPIKGRFTLTDFNCASFDKRLGTGDYYKIIWAKDKDVEMGIDGYQVTLKKNHILFCTPLNMIHLKPFIQGVNSFIFNREFYCIRDHDHEVSCNGFLFLGSSVPPMVELSEKEQKSFELLLLFFKEEFETRDHIQGEMLRVLLKRLIIKSVRLLKGTLVDPEMKQSKIDTIRQFNLLVEKHFREKHKVSDYADLLNKSPKTLSNLFAKYNNILPLQVINNRIILEAKKLLLYSEKSSKEIAYSLGFTEASHFSKFFKKQAGISPIIFKKDTLNIF